jgi:hypothetical protein
VELVIGPRFARTRWLGLLGRTRLAPQDDASKLYARPVTMIQ